MNEQEKLAQIERAAKYLSGLRRVGGNMAKKLPSWRSTAMFGGGAATGAGVAIGAPRVMNRVREISTMRENKGTLSYTDASKMTLRWKTYKGGPILEGPKNEMIRVIHLGKTNREAGIKELLRLIKSGVIRKVGTV